MKRGLFVTFEGGEGAGKSTAIAAAGEVLARHGIRYRATREPGGTPLGEALRALVLDPAHGGTCREAEVLMMFASRAQHIVEAIEPALAAGMWVVSDRFTDASWAYQGGGRGVANDLLELLERHAAFGLKPDRTILLDIPVDEGMRRIAGRGRQHISTARDCEIPRVPIVLVVVTGTAPVPLTNPIGRPIGPGKVGRWLSVRLVDGHDEQENDPHQPSQELEHSREHRVSFLWCERS